MLYVTHLLGEVEQLCDRVGVLVGGRLVYCGPVACLTTDRAGRPRSLETALQELYEKKVA